MSLAPVKSIYDFGSSQEYFQYLREHFPGRKKALTLSQFSQILGYKSPRSMAMVLKGMRLPSAEMIERVSQKVVCADGEKKYLELLVKKAHAEKFGKETRPIVEKLDRLRSKQMKKTKLSPQAEKYLQDWYHKIIYWLIPSPRFQEDPAWIARELKGKITPKQAEQSLEMLMQLGLVGRDEAGRLIDLKKGEIIFSGSDVPSTVIREHYRQNISRALEALEEESVLDRHIVSCGLRIRPGQTDEAKKAIREFYNDFMNRFVDEENGTLIYQLNIQFFKHNRGE